MKKPRWVIKRELDGKVAASETVWLFGLHAVREALLNPRRSGKRLIVTKNAANRLAEAISKTGIDPEIADPRRFPAPLDPGSVHQGAALETKPLSWGALGEVCTGGGRSVAVLLDRVTDPHNVGAILRSAAAFGACAVIATRRHSPPETGALAKSASGALEWQPYLRVRNLADTMKSLQDMGYALVGLDSEAETELSHALSRVGDRPIGLVLGAEGLGLRSRTRDSCETLVRIGISLRSDSLNVSNAAAIALYTAAHMSR
ncbi:MAG: 23S rRNA (guanosine(2251)-2'-O)-methyltransferase RlmB [Rhodobacter sp.]|nr:23S rRNA (guanosine(2251)-2'-O)-methyltransferase RlmB [Rhodobacter sp.]